MHVNLKTRLRVSIEIQGLERMWKTALVSRIRAPVSASERRSAVGSLSTRSTQPPAIDAHDMHGIYNYKINSF